MRVSCAGGLTADTASSSLPVCATGGELRREESLFALVDDGKELPGSGKQQRSGLC